MTSNSPIARNAIAFLIKIVSHVSETANETVNNKHLADLKQYLELVLVQKICKVGHNMEKRK